MEFPINPPTEAKFITYCNNFDKKNQTAISGNFYTAIDNFDVFYGSLQDRVGKFSLFKLARMELSFRSWHPLR